MKPQKYDMRHPSEDPIFCLLGFLLFLPFVVISCSDDGETIIRKKPKPTAPLSAEVSALLEEHCAGCHAAGKAQRPIDSLARLNQSKPRIANNTMPPGGGLADEVKEALLGN